MKKWGIVGLGWLGSELARCLTEKKLSYWGTTRETFVWERDSFPTEPCEVLFLNTPPLISLSPEEFVEKIPQDTAQKIIFISSIGVYGELSGTLTEKSIPCPQSKNGIWLLRVEELLLLKFQARATIIRAGGLIGEERHPVLSLAKNPGRVIADGVVNLIHRRDLIAIILKVSTQDISLINAVAPYHPSKSDYYHDWSQKLNLPLLSFRKKESEGRMITSEVLPLIFNDWQCLKLDHL